MSLPRFMSRVADAATPLLNATSREHLVARIAEVTIGLEAPVGIADDSARSAGLAFAANLLARMYPRFRLSMDSAATDLVTRQILSINPTAEIATSVGPSHLHLCWGGGRRSTDSVVVDAAGWNALVDQSGDPSQEPASPAAALAAAALGVGELFRSLFADRLGVGARSGKQPGVLNVVTLETALASIGHVNEAVDLGTFYLVGCGAIGQATVATLRHLDATGTLIAVDPEQIELSNLQRYVLSEDADENMLKTKIAARALKGSRLRVDEVPTVWAGDDRTGPGKDTLLSALDSVASRIGLQAGLPRRIYNAWTQPLDLGVSRHEAFGSEPCLACLYWPTAPRMHVYQSIAAALRQHELRVLAYLTDQTPVDSPLSPAAYRAIPGTPLPADAARWSMVSLLEDLASSLGVAMTEVERWRGVPIDGLYREAVCGGALITLSDAAPADTTVPLAHQSALAGVLLATQFYVASHPHLRALRSQATEARFNVLRGLPQELRLPRQRMPLCLCSDDDFRRFYNERWLG